ncbi:MAG: toll/interleukin-1 receptor domain-containing protein [Cyanobacteria bacterium P01_F01_bin.53]
MAAENSIFISYRRSDSGDLTGRIHDRLVDHFGRGAVFQDVDAIPYGVDFQAYLNERVGKARVVLAVIGPAWLETLLAREKLARAETADLDWVRLELETAIAHNIPVIPVLAGGVTMPSAEQLPDDLRSLATFHSALARPNPDFHVDMNRLVHRLEELGFEKLGLERGVEPDVVGGRCRNREGLQKYLATTTARLERAGSLAIRKQVPCNSSLEFSRVAKLLDFELGLGMRGEALFLFAEFAGLNFLQFQQFSAQALTWARAEVNPKSAGQAFYSFRVPTHLCFAVAIVDSLDEETRGLIRTTNPMQRRVDVLWYELPVVCELAEGRIYYYEAAANFWENFRGEIPLKKLRAVVRELLSP